MSQHKKLVVALISAVILGLCLHPFADILWLRTVNTHVLQPIGQIFLRMIFMIVVPLIFSALVIATNELSQSQGIGKIAIKTLGYTLMISALSVVIGIGLVNTIKPGEGFNPFSGTIRQIAGDCVDSDWNTKKDGHVWNVVTFKNYNKETSWFVDAHNRAIANLSTHLKNIRLLKVEQDGTPNNCDILPTSIYYDFFRLSKAVCGIHPKRKSPYDDRSNIILASQKMLRNYLRSIKEGNTVINCAFSNSNDMI